jgi:thymidylate synthase
MSGRVNSSTFGEGWRKILYELLLSGKESSPRGSRTREILNVTLEVDNALANVLVNPVRNLNYRFMIAEWLWIQAGLNDLNLLAAYNSNMKQFSDDGVILSGAYGPRLMPQIPYILDCLSKPDSRQAVATIWIPSPSNSKDIPCTISMQWLLREGVLHCTVNMRSSDVWLGLPYDFFTFSQLTNYVANLISAKVGSITMNLASSHIYEEHWDIGHDALGVASTTVHSPRLPVNEVAPNTEQIVRILNQQPNHLSPFWWIYQEALCHSKSHALEVLIGLTEG